MLPILLITHDQTDLDGYLAELINAQHISRHHIFRIKPEKDELTIGQVRAIRQETVLYHPQIRLFVLENFDQANTEAQNALLKTLEEKNATNLFVLVTNNEEKVLPTIRSRAQRVKLNNQATTVDATAAMLLKQIRSSTDARFLGDAAVAGIKRADALLLLEQLISALRAELAEPWPATLPTLKKAIETYALLQNNNLNPQMAVDTVLLTYFKSSQSK